MNKLSFMRHGVIILFFLLIIIAAAVAAPHNSEDVVIATIDVKSVAAPIHPYVYGMFTELLGNIFERGLWAEMLSDRKFFYPVDTTKNLTPVNTRRFQNRWRPVGGVEAVAMDRENSYVGEHTPVVQLAGSKPRGIQQSGLAVRAGKQYSGRVVLAGDGDARVTVSLVWAVDPDDKQTISVFPLTDDYLKYPFMLTAGADCDSATLVITGTGEGSYRIGAVSLMRADNIQGFRSDIIALLRELDSGIYRWPGGNMLAGYDWRDGIGDIDKRPPRYDHAWNAVESNDVGTEEFIVLCELLNIDPYFCVNIGFGDAYSAAQWVEYVNGSQDTPMGRIRALNGHPEPYEVEWWGIGNEMYGEWQLGYMSIEHYILKHNMFARAMRDVDPTIKLIASGATPFETSTTARHHRKPLPARLPYEFGSRQDWTGQLLAHCTDNIDFMAEHLYPVTTQAFDADSQKFVPVDDPIVDQVRRVPNRVKAVAESWKHYVKTIPGLEKKNITFALDEWTGGGWRSGFVRTLCAAAGLHEMFRHSDIITMGGYTAVTSNVRFTETDACYTAVGLLFKLYRHHLGTLPLSVSGDAPQHPVKGTIGVDRTAVTSGSDTYPLDIVAALTADRKTVTVAVMNPTEIARRVDLRFKGANLRDEVRRYQIAVQDLMVHNVPGQDPQIVIEETTWNELPDDLRVAPYSITLYEFMVK
ncbi:alpha-N-arabinofuranosidase [candidate division KSB1 bacterium]|nr:alpha-N-arabinofuranosidase [candidate division KSB1 bacterium]